ncbi:uncharacterized protein LOC123275329 isoform X1 [Cotesia glomerata]|uniref:uncharacterized protein LOC123275329 isoform X1 n=1 Tax=Cotesia glomerata TaxID=32391 RepID=UPI001D01E4CA|nr:uncharacterized protein LOC123275329 isoform X1 [Cotesia glomerata]
MGGVQSGTNSLGDGLWTHERQRQQSQRRSARYDTSQNGQNTQDRRKLLKRTRSLAVISEDVAKSDRASQNYHIGDPNLLIPRRPQLIPRAKLIDRNSLKDRLSKSQQHLSDGSERYQETRPYHSQSTCDLYTTQAQSYYHLETHRNRSESRQDPDRLNILNWPRTPRRYKSHQDLDTVSGLVDIVEDNWPLEEIHRQCDVYSQVKRKRKEHRSLDSILFEDEGELEYFDVLNLLPLSKVRLELDDSDNRNSNSSISVRTNQLSRITNFEEVQAFSETDEVSEDSELRHTPKILQVSEFSDDNQDNSGLHGSNVTDEEKFKSHTISGNEDDADKENDNQTDNDSQPPKVINKTRKTNTDEESWRSLISLSSRGAWETDSHQHQHHYHHHHHHREPLRITEEENQQGQPVEVEVEVAEEVEAREALPEIDNGDKANNSVEETSSRSIDVVDSPQSAADDSIILLAESNASTVDNKTIPADEKEIVTEIKRTVEIKSTQIPGITDKLDDKEKMSRRPQVLKIVDNEVTRRLSHGTNNIDNDIEDKSCVKKHLEVAKKEEKTSDNNNLSSESGVTIPVNPAAGIKADEPNQECEKRLSIERTRNFFEAKSLGMEGIKNECNQGRFQRIVKETSNIIGKACNAVKGSLGFEARSESSDLGLGSDCGSDTRRRSIDDGDDCVDDTGNRGLRNKSLQSDNVDKYLKPKTNLTRSHSCVDSIESQGTDGPEFDHIRYKIVKSRLFGKNIFSNVQNKSEGYDGLMDYLREYSFQELLLDNNVVIIEPVRAEPVEIKAPSMQNKSKSISAPCSRVTVANTNGTTTISNTQKKGENQQCDGKIENDVTKSPKQSNLRKHFFYHPISSVNRVNRELIDEELPDPDTVKNVREMFEATLRSKTLSRAEDTSRDRSHGKPRKSVSMKDLSSIDGRSDENSERNSETSRSRCSSRAKDLTRLFEKLDKNSSRSAHNVKGEIGTTKSDSKTKIIAQSFEARSGNTSPSDSGCVRNKIISATRYRQQTHHRRQRQNQNSWDAGSVSSGVSSDYPDTDPGSGVQCTSSEDEEIYCRDEDSSMRDHDNGQVHGHFVSQDVLRKIRECGTSVTYYGGKVVQTCNGPLISPMSNKMHKRHERLLGLDDCVKFRLVKSNSCDSRLELAGRVIERRSKLEARENFAKSNNSSYHNNNNNHYDDCKKKLDLRTCTIAETPSIEITALDSNTKFDEESSQTEVSITKREPPVVIGLEPKKDDNRNCSDLSGFKANFKLGKMDDSKLPVLATNNGFGSALTRWQINENHWNKKQEFGKMEFEEFEVLEDSLNGD